VLRQQQHLTPIFSVCTPTKSLYTLAYQTPARCIKHWSKNQIKMFLEFWIPHDFSETIQPIAFNQLQPLISIPFLPQRVEAMDPQRHPAMERHLHP